MTAIVIALIALFMALSALAVAVLAFNTASTNFKLNGMQLKLWEESNRLWWHHLQCHEIIDEKFGIQTKTKPSFNLIKFPEKN